MKKLEEACCGESMPNWRLRGWFSHLLSEAPHDISTPTSTIASILLVFHNLVNSGYRRLYKFLTAASSLTHLLCVLDNPDRYSYLNIALYPSPGNSRASSCDETGAIYNQQPGIPTVCSSTTKPRGNPSSEWTILRTLSD